MILCLTPLKGKAETVGDRIGNVKAKQWTRWAKP